MIRHRHPPKLHIVDRRKADLRPDLELSLTLTKLGPPPSKNHFVRFTRPQGRLISNGTEFARRGLPHIDKSPPAIPRPILAPAGHPQTAPSTVPASRAGHRHVIPAIRQKMNLRS